ncbi:unnamed protein product, partial [Dibothriocephalus latus]
MDVPLRNNFRPVGKGRIGVERTGPVITVPIIATETYGTGEATTLLPKDIVSLLPDDIVNPLPDDIANLLPADIVDLPPDDVRGAGTSLGRDGKTLIDADDHQTVDVETSRPDPANALPPIAILGSE